jgi:hypothetical protein
MFRLTLFVAPILASTLALSAMPVAAQTKPNILVIMGDDIGIWNLSTYHQGMMGYRTPNIDRLASEGAKLMTYSEPSAEECAQHPHHHDSITNW